MSIFKCKMCAGALEFNQGETVGVCQYCGTKQTLPKLDDEKRIQLYDRANHFRHENEYDKAMGIYEMILADDKEDSEAYWGIVLCKYGIEYVKDPRSQRRIPTVNRAQFTSVLDDRDYLSALEHADSAQREVYEAEAKAIDSIQKGILEISSKEEPFDVFICYKETDSFGGRTQDSVYAQEIYNALNKEGYKVFFARITLENKLGQQYEPFIFAALHSAKVMLVVGTSKENFNAVWVKNEWSRFLALAKEDSSKVIIPCYKDISPYDMPEEFTYLQSQDMSKIGYLQDIVHGVEKLVQKEAVKETVIVNNGTNANTAPLLKRAALFLEDGDWKSADEYCEKVLDLDPENGEAYLGKLMAEIRVSRPDLLAKLPKPFDNNGNYQKAVKFGNEKLRETLEGYNKQISERILTEQYNSAVDKMNSAKTEQDYKNVAYAFKAMNGFRDSKELEQRCYALAEEMPYHNAVALMKSAKTEKDYTNAASAFKTLNGFRDSNDLEQKCYKFAKYYETLGLMNTAKTELAYQNAINGFKSLNGFEDSEDKIAECNREIEKIRVEEEKKKIEAEKNRLKQAKRKKIIALSVSAIACVITFVILLTMVVIPQVKYSKAVSMLKEEKYNEAIAVFSELNGFKDSEAQLEKCYIGKLGEEKYNLVKNIKVGDTYKFGSYEQNNHNSDGKEKIEWIVLDKDGMSLLLISKYALDCQQFNSSNTDVTWETCSLRKWLNGTFLNAAFSAEEQNGIISSTVIAEKNPYYHVSPGNNTTDKVFLLSIQEVEKYFSSVLGTVCYSTDYAIAQGVYANTEYGSCNWWLRTIGLNYNYAVDIWSDGHEHDYGILVDSSNIAVRPAIWIDVSKLT